MPTQFFISERVLQSRTAHQETFPGDSQRKWQAVNSQQIGMLRVQMLTLASHKTCAVIGRDVAHST
jgi:hypothetical protein